MRITRLAHASILIESSCGTKLITDPAFFMDSLYVYPRPASICWELPQIDYMYISHTHLDHFDERTLGLIRNNISTALVLEEHKLIRDTLIRLGYNVQTIKSGETTKLRGHMAITAYLGDVSKFDSLAVIDVDNGQSILHANDVVLESPAFYEAVGNNHGIDYGFVPFDDNDCYPFIVDSPGSAMVEMFKAKQKGTMDYLIDIIRKMQIKLVFPYAWDIAFASLDVFESANPIRTTPQEFVAYANAAGLTAFTTCPGDHVLSYGRLVLKRDPDDVYGRSVDEYMGKLSEHMAVLIKEKALPVYAVPPPHKLHDCLGHLKAYFKGFRETRPVTEIAGMRFRLGVSFGQAQHECHVAVWESGIDVTDYDDQPYDLRIVIPYVSLLALLSDPNASIYGTMWTGRVKLGERYGHDHVIKDMAEHHQQYLKYADTFAHLFACPEKGY